MKILKIENGCGYYLAANQSEWIKIDEIDKEGLLDLLNLLLENDAEFDSHNDDNPISNQAHKIIYDSIHAKLGTLLENKSRFRDESQRLYLDEIARYAAE